MPPYLPVRAFNRNQQLRIGGYKVGPLATSYIDLGQLPAPTGLQTPTETTTGGTGFASATAYFWVVTAVDSYGGETQVSNEVTATTSADTTSYWTLRWLPIVDEVGNFIEPVGGYNVYRGTASGAEVFIANVSGGTIFNDGAAQTVAWGTTVSTVDPTVQSGNNLPNTQNNTAVLGQQNQNMRKELAQHSAIGAYYVVGGISNKNSDIVLNVLPTSLTLSTLTITPAGGELKNRSTGNYTPLLTTATTLAAKPASGSERFDIIAVTPAGLVVSLTGPVTTQVGNAQLPNINPANAGVITQTSVTTTSSNNVLSVPNTAGIQLGAIVNGTGLAPTSGNYLYVTAITPSGPQTNGTVTLSGNATGTATVTATFTNVVPIAVYLVNNSVAAPFATAAQFAPRP